MSSLFLAPFVVFCLYLTLKNLLHDQFSKVNELICIILYSFITEESRFPQVLLPKNCSLLCTISATGRRQEMKNRK